MFANAYQNGPFLQIWDSKVDPTKNSFYKQLAKTVNPQARAFDKEVKSYIYTFEGQHAKAILPADQSKTLSLYQRYLVLHMFVPLGFQWWMELGMSDISGMKRRINITTVQGKQEGKYFSYRYPVEITRGSWIFLGIDVFSFMEAFKGQTFRALDHITVGSTCKLKRIFTMKDFVEYQIPKGFWIAQEIPQSLELIVFKEQKSLLSGKLMTESKREEDIKQSMSGNRRQLILSEISPGLKKSPKLSKSLGKSEVIIQKAKNRLQHLQKEEQLLIQRSHELEESPIVKDSGKGTNKKRVKVSTLQNEIRNRSKKVMKHSPQEQKGKHIKTKLPPLERSFKEDEALNVHPEEESSSHTENNIAFDSKFLETNEYQKQDKKERRAREKVVPIMPASSSREGELKGIGVFPSTVITRSNDKEVRLQKSKAELELIYDQMVGCYYHPETNSYYQLKG